MALPKEVKESMKEKVRVVDVVREYLEGKGLEIRGSGEEFRSVCPFEEESTQSSKFRVSENMFYCYGCTEHGDIFDWYMKTEAMTYPEAEAYVAEKAGIDITPYVRSGKETEQDRLRRQVSEALGLIADRSKQVALALPVQERVISGIDVTSLVEHGEIGLLPTQEEITEILDKAHISAQVRSAAGIKAAGAEFSKRWVFWGKKRDAVVAGRLFGRPGPVVGQDGAKSVGWTIGPQGDTVQARAKSPLVVMDDVCYIQLRGAGIMSLARPVSPASLKQHRALARFENKTDSPVIVITADQEARANAFELALPALAVNPRLRVVEWTEAYENKTGPEMEALLKDQAGTILDWQLDRLARVGGFQTPEKLAQSKKRVNKIVEAVKDHPLEHSVYKAIIEEMTTPPKPKSREQGV